MKLFLSLVLLLGFAGCASHEAKTSAPEVLNTSAKNALGIAVEKEITIFDCIDNLGGKFDIRGRLEESVKLKKEYASERILLNEKFFKIFVFPVKSNSVLGQENVTGGVVIFHDVTSEVEVETIKKDFTSMLVHELRSPLDGIKKISEVLKNKNITQTEESHNEYIELIYKNSSGMLEIVNDILDVAKIESGKFEIQKNEGDIKKTISDRVNFYSISSQSLGVSLSVSFGKDIPEKMMFDQEGVDHILNNLISNGLKYTNKGGMVKVVAFLHNVGIDINEEARLCGYNSSNIIPPVSPDVDSIIVLVSDNGIGIDKDNIGNIFSKFKQLDTKDKVPKKKGTGLGLVIAKGIVEEHGGHIGVVSELSTGSTFYFNIPLL
jgi:signal transduction histidine kinase